MTSRDPSICATCGKSMTLVFKGKRKSFTCDQCDSDPLKSPKVDALLRAGSLQPPK